MITDSSVIPSSPRAVRAIILLTAVALTASLLSSCGTYPLGDSHYPKYYGGHGSPVSPTGHVPKELQRCDTWRPWF